MAAARKFWDRVANRYARMPISDQDLYEKKLSLTRKYLGPDLRVLDLGCGTGSMAILHAPYVKHIEAVDISPKMIDIARTRAREAGVENIAFSVADIAELQAPDESFDVVLALSILHLLDGRDQAIAKVFRLLKPGGVFISNTYCIGGGKWFLKALVRLAAPLGLMPNLFAFNKDELLNSLKQAGFEIERDWQPDAGKAVFLIARKPARKPD